MTPLKGDMATLEPTSAAPASAPLALPAAPSAARAWCFLVWHCLRRQARARQMVWIALALLGLTATVVALNTASDRWGMWHWRVPRRNGPTFEQTVQAPRFVPRSAAGTAVQDAVLGSCEAVLQQTGFYVFSSWIVFSVFLSFLLPIWSLSFATEALGGEREAGTLVWLLTRPLSRPAVYLAKFAALLPWALGLNLGGFGLLCLAAGRPGHLAFQLFWPAVAWGSLAFCSLFHLMSACISRPAVVAIVYSFFLETVLGNMPGYMKRVSISFYTRCLMFDQAQDYGLQPQKASIYLPVDGPTAWWVLVGLTVGLLAVGTVVFARSESREQA
jgi:ABC-type transport system involved in multi-copper enzyme maturation permease subunit